ncbi:hsp70-like protein [Schizosaccharomyces japonicus yFS275]|uniref:Hsp70-like protein n=1 Tax=Schizosaccharomyces japonicus (strain yFS275 / FY16936) TaxID=402676 RepID=B6JY95_SCHJY|nr:hsp70-like protein [Schizosaccharomyces japonicus yFS275]EEB06513.1 hsp70-like protein [Schizosaccharomyces japonicus yFS275]
MEKLLALATSLSAKDADGAEATAAAPVTTTPGEKIDTSVLDHIFGANPAEEMKQAMAAIEDPEVTLENKEVAFDNLEMLVEQIDNANNLVPLQLWDPLLKQLQNEEPSLRKLAAWTVGTAVQNNPTSQQALLDHSGLSKLFDALRAETDDEVKSKLLYALSNELKFNYKGLARLNTVPEAWNTLMLLLEGQNSTIVKRLVFFLYAILAQEDDSSKLLLEKCNEYAVADKVVRFILQHRENEDCVDKGLQTLFLLLEKKARLTTGEQLAAELAALKTEYEHILTATAWETLQEMLARKE